MNVHKILNSQRTTTTANSILLFLVFTTIFIVPVFPREFHPIVFNLLLTFIYLTSVLATEKYRLTMFITAMTAMIMEWLSDVLQLQIIHGFSKGLNIFFFLTVVVFLVIQVAKSKKVNFRVIMEAINVYLLLGMVFSLLITLAMLYDHNAFNFPFRDSLYDKDIVYFSEYLYYGFVTFTTLGYGDIVPLKPYAKSLAVLASVTGQIYVAVVIAMLVGKFSSSD